MQTHEVDTAANGVRLDVWLTNAHENLSRARWQALIKQGHVQVDGREAKPHHVLHAGERVTFEIPPPLPTTLEPEPIPLDVIYEDEDLIVVNKQTRIVVHPAPGHASGTLVNALLYHCKDLAGVGGEQRPGIVHRLDRDTTGVLVVAKNEAAMRELARQFKRREVKKVYLALVWGHPQPERDRLETLVGRSMHDRKKMSATPVRGRRAVTVYETVERLQDTTLLRVEIETGRTHQIRVHMAHAGHPVLGDKQYGGSRKSASGDAVPRQMLHAHQLTLTHPRTGQVLEFVAPMPSDMQDVVRSQRGEAPGDG